MSAMRIRFAALAFAAAMAATTPVLADQHSAAVKLFEEGRQLRDRGELEKAAVIFAQSITTEPSVGAYYNLGLINDQLNRPREAVEAFRKSRDLAAKRNDPREKDSVEALGKLLDARNYVLLETADDVTSAPGLRVMVDGEAVPAGQLKGETFRTPSSHEVVISATGRADVRLQARNKQVVKVILGEPTAATAPPPPPPGAPATGGWGWQKWAGAGMIAGGVVSLTIFVATLVPYLGKRSDLDDEIESGTVCTKSGDGYTCPSSATDLVRRNNANVIDGRDKTPLWVVTASLGALLVGGGIYLLATAPSSSAPAESASKAPRIRVVPQVGMRENGLTVVGSF